MNTQPRLIRVEPVADLPVIWFFLQQIDLIANLDRHFPTPPHWKGPLTQGEVLGVWLLFIISQSDHRLNHVEPWAEQHQGVISALVGKPVRGTDFHDDRLADCLSRLTTGGQWAALEHHLNQQIVRVYQLPAELIRIDATTANSHADVVSETGLLQFGHSKDDPSRPQFKVAAAVLDPLGMPLATAVVPGNTADDPLYVPAIRSVRQSLGTGGKTYVGDCKMAALATRAYVASGGDFYLCPLPETQLSRSERKELLAAVWDGTQLLQKVSRPDDAAADELVAEGFPVEVKLSAEVDGRLVSWTERRWLVRSQAFAQTQEAALDRRLAKAEAALQALTVRKQGKKVLSEAELQAAAEAVPTQHGVAGLLHVTVRSTTVTSRKRAYGKRPASEVTTVSRAIETQRNEAAIHEAKRELGWQVYGTNGLEMGLHQVVWAYRGQYRIENDWSRLKGRPLGLTPLYFQDEERIQGLVYLLSLALRVLTLVEWVVREDLRKTKTKLKGVYAGQGGRQTSTPSAELLLAVMKTISISVVEIDDQVHMLLTPPTEAQKRLLKHWGLPPDLYEKVAHGFPKTPPNTSEP
jgi:transposase